MLKGFSFKFFVAFVAFVVFVWVVGVLPGVLNERAFARIQSTTTTHTNWTNGTNLNLKAFFHHVLFVAFVVFVCVLGVLPGVLNERAFTGSNQRPTTHTNWDE